MVKGMRRARRARPARVEEPFRMVACPGGPILEIPRRGRFIFERLSPGTIRERDYYEEFRIVPGGAPGMRLLVACPRGAFDRRRGVCRVGLRALRIWHPRERLRELLRRCRTGRLARERASLMRAIQEDIRRARRGLSPRDRATEVGGLELPGRSLMARAASAVLVGGLLFGGIVALSGLLSPLAA